jgi:hypothetical protein
MTTVAKLIEGGPRKVTVKIEIDGAAPEMGIWNILDKYKNVTATALKTDIARAMSQFMGHDVTRQMVERWFTRDPMMPRTDYFLALVAVLARHFKIVDVPKPTPREKRPPGRPRIHPTEAELKTTRPRGRPRQNVK